MTQDLPTACPACLRTFDPLFPNGTTPAPGCKRLCMGCGAVLAYLERDGALVCEPQPLEHVGGVLAALARGVQAQRRRTGAVGVA